MCLEIKENEEIKVAERNITCYKFIEKYYDTNKLTTPYKYFEVEIGCTYKSKLVKNGLSIGEGLHSFKNKSNAIKDAKHFTSENRSTLVVKCRIPKGSKYYIGSFDGCAKTPSYASDCIEYLEIVEEYKIN